VFDLTWEEGAGQSMKREREEDEGGANPKIPKQSLKFKLKDLLNELNEEVTDLQKITETEYPMNVELAEKVATIQSLLSNIKTDDFTRRADGGAEAGLCQRCREYIEKEVQPEEILRVNSFQKVEELAKKEWPEALLCRVKRVIGNPLQSAKQSDLVLTVPEDDHKIERGIARLFADRFPELRELEQ
jgi:hypothetical protein